MKTYIPIFIFILHFSCNHIQVKRNSVVFNQSASLSPMIDSLLKDYTLKNKGLFYVVFFDKKQDAEFELSSEYRLTFAYSLQNIPPEKINCTGNIFMNDGTPVYLISGIEEFLSRKFETIDNSTFRKSIVWQKSISYIHTRDTAYSVEGDNYPFMNMTLRPTIIFDAPKETQID